MGAARKKEVVVDPLAVREPQDHERVCMFCERASPLWTTFVRCVHVLCAACAPAHREASCRYGTRWDERAPPAGGPPANPRGSEAHVS